MSDLVFPRINDTVEFYVVAIYGFLVRTVYIILVELFNSRLSFFQNKGNTVRKERFRKFAITTFHGLSLFLLGCGITLLLTESKLI